ncbi:PAS domain S-box protein [Chlamydiota bacterium]
MNILIILHFFSLLVFTGLSSFILSKNPRSRLHQTCSLFIFCFAIWSIGLIFIHNPNSSLKTVQLCQHFDSVGWISFASFFLWFCMLFTKKDSLLKKKYFYFILFLPPLFFVYQQCTGNLIINYTKVSYGWSYFWEKTIWVPLFFSYYSLFIFISLYLILEDKKTTKNKLHKKQCSAIFIPVLFSYIFGSINNVLFPFLELHHIPVLANVICLSWAIGVVYSIVYFKFLDITPETAAQNIISTMSDSLILLNNSGDIIKCNQATFKITGFKADALNNKHLNVLVPEAINPKTILKKIQSGVTLTNTDIIFRTKTGKHVPMLLSTSPLMDSTKNLVGIVCISRDITHRKKTEEALRESEKRFQDIAKNAREWIWEVDMSGKYTYVSPIVKKILGYSQEEVLTKHFYDFFEKKNRKELKKSAFSAFSNKESFRNFINCNIHKNGEQVWLSTSAIPLINEKGDLIGYRGLDIDITDTKKIELLKDEFISTVSHELRTPLAVIKEAILQIRDELLGKTTVKQRNILTIANNNIDRLTRIISGLLNISKIEKGEIILIKEKIKAYELLTKIIHSFTTRSQENNVTIELQCTPKTIELFVDADKLIQIFLNLIDNALKFTKNGTLSINVSESNNSVFFKIIDTGIGISSHNLPHIFDKFQQFDRSYLSGEKGTGLGLSIVKKIIELHKGTITAQSSLGKGTIISFSLPKKIM